MTQATLKQPHCGKCPNLESEVKGRQAQTTNKCVKGCYQYESFQRAEAACVAHIAEIIQKLRAKMNA